LINGLATSCDDLHHGLRAKNVDADSSVAEAGYSPVFEANDSRASRWQPVPLLIGISPLRELLPIALLKLGLNAPTYAIRRRPTKEDRKWKTK
jgi:hypothetical protein